VIILIRDLDLEVGREDFW